MGPSFISSAFKAAAALPSSTAPLHASCAPTPGLPVARRGRSLKRWPRRVTTGESGNSVSLGGRRGRGGRSAVSPCVGRRVTLQLCRLPRSAPFPLVCDLKSYFRVNKWPGRSSPGGRVWLNMEKWLLMDERPRGPLAPEAAGAAEPCSVQNKKPGRALLGATARRLDSPPMLAANAQRGSPRNGVLSSRPLAPQPAC